MTANTSFTRWIAMVSLLVAPLAQALDNAAEEGHELLAHFMDDVQTFSGRFEQSLLDADGEVVEESSGTLEIQRPGRFRWAYDLPYEQVLVADGLNIWSYDVDLAQVIVKPQAEVLGSTPASLLGGSADVLDDFELVSSDVDRNTTWVRLRPRNPEGTFKDVQLGFTNGELSRMIFSDNLEQTTLVALFDVAVNEPIAADRFVFSPPPNADLVGTPLASEPSVR